MENLTTLGKIKRFILNLVTKYLVWIVIAAVLIIWYFFPELIDLVGQIIIFWAPMTILLLALFIALTTNFFKLNREREQGRSQFDIIVTAFDIYILDIIVYGGSILILFLAFVLKTQRVEPLDLIYALVYFVFTNWIKQLFINKIDR